MNFKRSFLLLLLLPLFAFTAHKYYLSLTQIEYNETANSVEIIINVFVDDIEDAINDIYKIDARLDTKKEIKEVDSFYLKYLKNHVKFKIDGKNVSYNFIGKEYEYDAVFFYLEIPNITSVKNIVVENTVLIQHFPTQQNLIKSKVKGKHKSELLTKKETKAELKY